MIDVLIDVLLFWIVMGLIALVLRGLRSRGSDRLDITRALRRRKP